MEGFRSVWLEPSAVDDDDGIATKISSTINDWHSTVDFPHVGRTFMKFLEK